jgi:hypothetical protein
MELKHILYQVSDGIATITINRADVLNALSAVTVRGLGGPPPRRRMQMCVIILPARAKSLCRASIAGWRLDPVAGRAPVELARPYSPADDEASVAVATALAVRLAMACCIAAGTAMIAGSDAQRDQYAGTQRLRIVGCCGT